jgi:hypothetical protein
MLHEGRWLASANYRVCLKASVMLAIMLEDSIKTARTVLEHQQGAVEPYSIASYHRGGNQRTAAG